MKNDDGQTLIEVVVAIALVGLTLTSMVVAATIGITSARLAKERSEARHLVENRLEEARRERDTDPELFFSLGTRTDGPESVGPESMFEMTTTYTELVADEKMGVTVEIEWSDGGRIYVVNQSTYLNKWQ